MQVVVADDQAKVRSALRLLLENQEDVNILGEAVDARGLQDWLRVADPDVVLLDWELPGLTGDALVPRLRAAKPDLHIIALSVHPEASERALEAGADAFVSKGDPPEHLLGAIATYRSNTDLD